MGELAAVEAINDAVGRLYGGNFADSWATIVSWAVGGPQPLDRVRCYRAKDHWHYVGYGLSDLDQKSIANSPLSGFGFELTFRLRGVGKKPPIWPVNLLQSLALYVWDYKRGFADGHWFPFSAKWQQEFGLAGVVFVTDPEVAAITTDYGKVTFLQVVGVSPEAMERIKHDPERCWDAEVAQLRRRNPLLVTEV
jgi:suppressor of fused